MRLSLIAIAPFLVAASVVADMIDGPYCDRSKPLPTCPAGIGIVYINPPCCTVAPSKPVLRELPAHCYVPHDPPNPPLPDECYLQQTLPKYVIPERKLPKPKTSDLYIISFPLMEVTFPEAYDNWHYWCKHLGGKPDSYDIVVPFDNFIETNCFRAKDTKREKDLTDQVVGKLGYGIKTPSERFQAAKKRNGKKRLQDPTLDSAK